MRSYSVALSFLLTALAAFPGLPSAASTAQTVEAENLLAPTVSGAWRLVRAGAGAAVLTREGDAIRVETTRAADLPAQVQFFQQLPFLPLARYRLRFAARADRPRRIAVTCQSQWPPFRNVGLSRREIELTSAWQTFEMGFAVDKVDYEAVGIPKFLVGDQVGAVWVRDVVLVADAWQPRAVAPREALRDPARMAPAFEAALKDAPPDAAERVSRHQHLGELYAAGARWDEAAAHYNRALALLGGSGAEDLPRRSYLLRTLGNLSRRAGRLYQALAFYGQAAELDEKRGARSGSAANLYDMGGLYEQIGQPEKALRLYLRTSASAQALEQPENVVRVLRRLSAVYLTLSRTGDALDASGRASQIAAARNDPYEMAVSRVYEAAVYRAQGQLDRAVESYRKALPDLGGKFYAVMGRRGLADTLFQQGQYEPALQTYQEALGIAARDVSPIDVAALSAGMGRAQSRLLRHDAAVESYRRAVEVFEQVSEQAGEASEVGQFQQALVGDVYSRYAESVLQRGRPDEALAAVERGRSQGLAQQAARSGVDLTRYLSPGDAAQLRAKTRALTLAGAAVHGAQQEGIAAGEARQKRDEAARDLSTLRDALFARYPEFGQIQGARPATPEQLLAMSRANPETLYLTFACLDDGLLRFALRNGRLDAARLPAGREALAGQVRRWRDAITDRLAGEPGMARGLARALIQGVDLAGARRLVIAADGPLLDVPFAALVVAEPGGRLVERLPVSLTFSLNALNWATASTKPSAPLLCAADPTGTGGKDAQAGLRGGFAPLPGARKEGRAVAGLFRGARTLAGSQAREGALKRQMGHHGLLHFATHGVAEPKQGMLSALILAPEPAGSAEDGALTAQEIAGMKLAASLAVLSACETARGQKSGGEGLLGLAWAFRAAGCPAVVASQWKVEDAATERLMLTFYKSLKAGRRKSDALRDAMLSVKKMRPEPFFWAAFQLIGDTRPLAEAAAKGRQ